MPAINFFGGENFALENLGGSGLGFFGDGGFGFAISVGSYQGRTFITNSNGSVEGPEVDNLKYESTTTAIIGQSGPGIALNRVPNYLATVNIRFTHSSAVQTQNALFYGHDRSSKTNLPSGVTYKAFEIIHPEYAQTATGSGDTTWHTLSSGTNSMALAASPGTSGLSPNGPSTSDDRHDWYVGISLSPESVGAKSQIGMFVELEYL